MYASAKVIVSLKGELEVSHVKPLSAGTYDVAAKSFESEWTSKAPREMAAGMMANLGFKYSPIDDSVEFSCALVHESKVGGKTFLCTEVSPVPPNKIIFKCKPRPVNSTLKDSTGAPFSAKGNVWCEIEFEFNPKISEIAMIPVYMSQPITQSTPESRSVGFRWWESFESAFDLSPGRWADLPSTVKVFAAIALVVVAVCIVATLPAALLALKSGMAGMALTAISIQTLAY
jgi:hypothetical protein